MAARFKEGPLSQAEADTLNQLVSQMGTTGIWVAPPWTTYRGPLGQITLQPPPPDSVWALLTDEDTGAFSFVEYELTAPATWTLKNCGQNGLLNAYPIPGVAATVGQYVRIWKSRSLLNSWEFTNGGAGASFWARITSGYTGGPTPNGVSWTRVELVAGGTWADTVPAVTGVLNAYVIETQQRIPLVDIGTIVRLWPSPTVPGMYEFDPEPFDSFWAEITSGPSTSAYSWKKKVLSGTSFVDASPSFIGSSNAYPVTMDGTVPVVHVGSTVRIWRSPTVSGKFEFEISQFANFTMPGSVSITTQVFAGEKTFATDLVTVRPDDYLTTNNNAVNFQLYNSVGGLDVLIYSAASGTPPVLNFYGHGSVANFYGIVNCNNALIVSAGYGFGANFVSALAFQTVAGDQQYVWYIGPAFGAGSVNVMRYSGTTNVLNVIDGTSNPSHVYVGDTATSTLRLPSSSSYWVGSDQGITATRIFDDNSGSTHTVVIKGGIITSWVVYP